MIVYQYEKFTLDVTSEDGMTELNRLGFNGWKLEAVVENSVIMSLRGFNLTPERKG